LPALGTGLALERIKGRVEQFRLAGLDRRDALHAISMLLQELLPGDAGVPKDGVKSSLK